MLSLEAVLPIIRWLGIVSLTVAVVGGVIAGYLDYRRICKRWREDKSAL